MAAEKTKCKYVDLRAERKRSVELARWPAPVDVYEAIAAYYRDNDAEAFKLGREYRVRVVTHENFAVVAATVSVKPLYAPTGLIEEAPEAIDSIPPPPPPTEVGTVRAWPTKSALQAIFGLWGKK